MQDHAPFDWRAKPPPTGPGWTKNGSFRDRGNRPGTIGSTCRLLRATIAHDEKGQRQGLFAAGEQFEVRALSTTGQALIYFEGVDSLGGWCMSAVPPDDVALCSPRPTERQDDAGVDS